MIPHDIKAEILSSSDTEEEQVNGALLIAMHQHPSEDPNSGNMQRYSVIVFMCILL